MRLLMLLPCFALAACLTTTEESAQTPPAQPAAATAAAPAATPPAGAKPEAPARRGAPAAGRAQNAPYVPPQQPVQASPDAIIEIRQICWSEANKQRGMSLEGRADWVTKCVAEKSKAAGI